MASYLYMYKIDKNIYMCCKQKATDLETLEDEDIKGMLYLNPTTKSESVLEDYTELDIHHYHIPIEDNDKLDFKPFLERIVNIIQYFDLKDLKILVYCETGTRLAPVAIIVYILYKYYIVNKLYPKNNDLITPSLLRMIQKKNSEVDFQSMYNIVQQLVIFEGDLKKKVKKTEKVPHNIQSI